VAKKGVKEVKVFFKLSANVKRKLKSRRKEGDFSEKNGRLVVNQIRLFYS